jgi:hypothetical protein
MAATAAARRGVDLADTPARFAVTEATRRDEGDIAALLRDTPFGDDVRVSLERMPSPLAASTIEGDIHQLMVARDRSTGRVAGIAARSVRETYVNGEAVRIGYLGQLRIDRSCRHLRALLDAGFTFCKALHDRGDASFHVSSIVEGNDMARRLLTGRLSRSAPGFAPIANLRTFAIGLGRLRTFHARGVRVEAATGAHADDIAACLARNLRRYQLAPRWTVSDLRSDRTRNLAAEDFVVAVRDGRVVGCLAQWDQSAFKQVVVRGYSKRLARWRPVLNLAGPWVGAPHLPPVGQPLRFAYLSHAAVDDDCADVLAALVSDQCRRARAAGVRSVVTGFVSSHPFFDVISRCWRHRAYDSTLYVSAWPDAQQILRSLDGRPLQPEVAVL